MTLAYDCFVRHVGMLLFLAQIRGFPTKIFSRRRMLYDCRPPRYFFQNIFFVCFVPYIPAASKREKSREREKGKGKGKRKKRKRFLHEQHERITRV